jgi:RNA recognition motif-containing protein
LREKLKIQCPCGYGFETFSDEKNAIHVVQIHFEQFHKEFLPFGITEDEALALLKKENANNNQKRAASISFAAHAKSSYNLGNSHPSAHKKTETKLKLIEQ